MLLVSPRPPPLVQMFKYCPLHGQMDRELLFPIFKRKQIKSAFVWCSTRQGTPWRAMRKWKTFIFWKCCQQFSQQQTCCESTVTYLLVNTAICSACVHPSWHAFTLLLNPRLQSLFFSLTLCRLSSFLSLDIDQTGRGRWPPHQVKSFQENENSLDYILCAQS